MMRNSELSAVLAGTMATLTGIGLARFAYTPLLPAVIEQGWFGPSQAAYLGAANLLGYLLGALSAHTLSERFAPRRVMALCFVGIGASFLLCAMPGAFAWFFLWRLVSGAAGGILMVVGPSLALASTPAERRPMLGALVFTGIGLGALISATVVPLLLILGLTATWLTLGALSMMAGLAGDRGMAHLDTPPPTPDQVTEENGQHQRIVSLTVLLIIAAYGLDAAGFVPHTVFWVDYLTREANLGLSAASLQWALFGIGAVAGPWLTRHMAQCLGWHKGLILAFLVKAMAVALPLFSISPVSRSISSLIVGAMIPGIVALTSGRLAELVGPTAHKRLWGYATAAFAGAQALAGYGMSALYANSGTYHPLFAIGAFMLASGFLLILLSRLAGASAGHGSLSPTRTRRH